LPNPSADKQSPLTNDPLVVAKVFVLPDFDPGNGGLPEPPPKIGLLRVKTGVDVHVFAELKYGIPPLVPATENPSVPDVVIGDPETEISPPVKEAPTLIKVGIDPEYVVLIPLILNVRG
jgi:hypothetical protein